MNDLAEAVIDEAKAIAKVGQYKIGLRFKGSPPQGDCRGFVETSFGLAQCGPAIGGEHANVRGEVKWAKANGRFRDPASIPGRAWLIFYNEPSAPATQGNPDRIRHVGLVLQPVTKRWPKGRVVSALNPELDIRFHNLNLNGYAIYGYLEPDWEAVVDPEPPVDPALEDMQP